MLKKINWRYAIGELFIVIIGITIAFGLNNWAQNQRNQELTQTYLHEIHKDLGEDLETLEQNLSKLQVNHDYLESIIPHFFQPQPGSDTIPITFFRRIHEYVVFFPHNATFESMLHAGDLKLIKDFQLKNDIVEHYNNYTKLFRTMERHENFGNKYSAEFFMKETDHLKLFNHQHQDLLSLPYMKNMLFSSKGIMLMQIAAHQEAITACQEMQSKIEAHL